MGLLDPYITKADYSAIARRTVDDDDEALDEEVAGSSRVLERELGVAPGAWNSAAGTRNFTGTGEALLVLRDELGLHFLQSFTGINIDTDRDGVADYAVAPDTWIIPTPRNAVSLGEAPYALQILDRVSGAGIAVFPEGADIEVEGGVWGHTATPAMIKQIVAFMVRDIRDHHAGQALAGAQQLVESGITVRDDTWRLILRAKKAYSHRRPGTG